MGLHSKRWTGHDPADRGVGVDVALDCIESIMGISGSAKPARNVSGDSSFGGGKDFGAG